MIEYIYNDGGRSLSKRPKQKRDCVIRAISIVAYESYDKIYDELAFLGRKSGSGTKKEIWKELLNSKSFNFTKISFPAITGQARMNLANFCELYPQGRYVIQMAGHLTAVIDGIIMDDFKPIETKCVYCAWKNSN
jgi:hypothetical protein